MWQRLGRRLLHVKLMRPFLQVIQRAFCTPVVNPSAAVKQKGPGVGIDVQSRPPLRIAEDIRPLAHGGVLAAEGDLAVGNHGLGFVRRRCEARPVISLDGVVAHRRVVVGPVPCTGVRRRPGYRVRRCYIAGYDLMPLQREGQSPLSRDSVSGVPQHRQSDRAGTLCPRSSRASRTRSRAARDREMPSVCGWQYCDTARLVS